MGALLSIHNDGPDAVHVRIGGRWVQLQAGEGTRVNATVGVEFEPIPTIKPEDMALHQGYAPDKPKEPACRLANED